VKEEERGFASADCRPGNSRRVARAQDEADRRLFRIAPLPLHLHPNVAFAALSSK